MSALRTAVLAHFRAGNPGPALTVESGTYSYDVLGRVAADAANHIRSAGGSDGGLRIAVLSSGTLTAYVALLAAFELDAAYVPLDPTAPVDRLRDALVCSHADIIIIDQRHPDVVTELGQEWPLFDPADGVWCGAKRRSAAAAADADGSPHDRYVLFTSGSTGVPKGIGIPDRCIEAMFGAMAEIAPVQPHDVVAQTFDLTFDLAQYSTLACWIAGAHLAVLSASERLDPAHACQHLGVTYWFSVPSVARSAAEAGRLGEGLLAQLRVSLFCGEALPEQLARSWQQATSGEVWNLYGPTEATIACAAHLLRADEDHRGTGIVPLGAPLRGTRLGLLSQGRVHDLASMDGRADGELLIAGEQLFSGYLDDPGRTALAFVTDESGATWYRSGDRVEVDPAGAIGYLGRTDEQVQLRGYRVEPREVEYRIAAALGLRSDQVVVVPVTRADGTVSDLAAGLGHPAASGGASAESQVHDLIRGALPAYMQPTVVRRFESFPLNPNGKIDRGAIRTRLAEELAGPHA